jgi:hypothetical protein
MLVQYLIPDFTPNSVPMYPTRILMAQTVISGSPRPLILPVLFYKPAIQFMLLSIDGCIVKFKKLITGSGSALHAPCQGKGSDDMNMKYLSGIAVLACLILATAPVQALSPGQDFNGPHYTLNIIGVPNTRGFS